MKFILSCGLGLDAAGRHCIARSIARTARVAALRCAALGGMLLGAWLATGVPLLVHASEPAVAAQERAAEAFRLGRFEESRRALGALPPRTDRDHYNLANVLYRLGEPTRARLHLRAALEIAPWNARAWQLLELTESKLGLLATRLPLPLAPLALVGLCLALGASIWLGRSAGSDTTTRPLTLAIPALALTLGTALALGAIERVRQPRARAVASAEQPIFAGPGAEYTRLGSLAPGELAVIERVARVEAPATPAAPVRTRKLASQVDPPAVTIESWAQLHSEGVQGASTRGWVPLASLYRLP